MPGDIIHLAGHDRHERDPAVPWDDLRHRKPAILALIDALGEGPYRLDEPAVEVFTRHFLGRWRDPGNARTPGTFRDAARKLSPGVLKGLIADAERPGVNRPAHHSTTAADELGWLRERRKARRAG